MKRFAMQYGSRLAIAVLILLEGCSGNVAVRQATVTHPVTNADADGDGVPDSTDKCPKEREDGLPPDPKDGCRSKDPDGDGVLGDADKCPLEAETRNGVEDEDGCPDAKVTVTRQPRVTVTRDELKIDEKILFAFGKATIDQASDALIKEIAETIMANPKIELIEVAGHADQLGNDALNVSLTKRRAEAVANSLVSLGVEKGRLRIAGYGSYCPIDQGTSEESRERNRRVEFKIQRVSNSDIGAQLGCSAAATKGVKSTALP